jgi:hypothetical protein
VKTKLAFLAAIVTLAIAAPALADSSNNDETTAAKLDELTLQTGDLNAINTAPRLIAFADDPAQTGGGSSGYNAMVREDN